MLRPSTFPKTFRWGGLLRSSLSSKPCRGDLSKPHSIPCMFAIIAQVGVSAARLGEGEVAILSPWRSRDLLF